MLENISTQELEEELKRRKNTIKSKPKPRKQHLDFDDVINECKGYVDKIYNNITIGETFDYCLAQQRIFETAMNAIYPDSVWSWIDECGY